MVLMIINILSDSYFITVLIEIYVRICGEVVRFYFGSEEVYNRCLREVIVSSYIGCKVEYYGSAKDSLTRFLQSNFWREDAGKPFVRYAKHRSVAERR